VVYRTFLQAETEFLETFTAASIQGNTIKSGMALPKGEAVRHSFAKAAAEEQTELGINNATQLTTDILDAARTELLQNTFHNKMPLQDEEKTTDFTGFDAYALEGRYILEEELTGAGMSRVFVARNAKLGNRWIIKYISHHNAALAKEENILKQLNHISLPQIVDIFYDTSGVYLVESYIEGFSLDAVLAGNTTINQALVLDWAEQMAQVLAYLHNIKPNPIYHYDLKPSNVMVTYDNRLVLIDFGVSKQLGEGDGAIGVTYKYAAPERLKYAMSESNLALLESRFGTLPEERFHWQPDARTDIYSLGVMLFELAVRQLPDTQNFHLLKNYVSGDFYKIIQKCLKTNPQDRYEDARALLADLQKIKGSKSKMVKTLFLRKFAFIILAICILASLVSLGGGCYLYVRENQASFSIEPILIRMSLQQSTELKLEKKMADGTSILLDPLSIRWSFTTNNIARIDGNRIVGLNLGETELLGQYRNKKILLKVDVVKQLTGLIDIRQIYQPGHMLELFAGTASRELRDGVLGKAEFISTESIDISQDGDIYFVDSGFLRKISNNMVKCIDIQPSFYSPRIVRCGGAKIYILTHIWEDDDGVNYGIVCIDESGVELIYRADAYYSAVEDFVITEEVLYFIERNEGINKVYLKSMYLSESYNINTLCELPRGSWALTLDEEERVYIANAQENVILLYYKGSLSYFAGIKNEQAIIDGVAPLFFMPQRLRYASGYLYIWDYNVLRRMEAVDGLAKDSITLIGEATPQFEFDIIATKQSAETAILPNSLLTEFAFFNDGILLTDPKRGMLWFYE